MSERLIVFFVCFKTEMQKQCWSKKILSGVKSLQNFTFFIGKVSNDAILRFSVAFFGTFWNLMFVIFCTIWVFWAFDTVLSQIIFVVIYALFRVKYFGSYHVCVKKIVFLHVCSKKAQGLLGWPVLASKSGLRVWKGLLSGIFGHFVTPATHSHSDLRAWNSKKNDGKWIVMLKTSLPNRTILTSSVNAILNEGCSEFFFII